MAGRILGLDLGVASIGWCLFDSDEGPIVAMGSRVFQSALEDKTPTPKNAKRRTARGLRKTIRRRQMRRDALVGLLREHGLLPAGGAAWFELFSDHARNPYLLRARGLDQQLAPHEFGRVLFHLARRRGFKSNRRTQLVDLERDPEIAQLIRAEEEAKASAADKPRDAREEEEGKVAKEVAALRAEIAASGSRTLGEHFAKLISATDENGCLAFPSIRRRHTERAMYEEEFDAIWDAQARYRPQELTPGLKARVHDAIFHQRPLKVQRFAVGKCRFEPDRIRADRAHPAAHEFRIWQLLANLTYRLPDEREDRSLTMAQRHAVATALQATAKMTWGGLKKAAGLPKIAVMSHEGKSGHTDIGGNTTVIRIERAAPGLWSSLDQTRRDQLITSLLTIDRKDALVRHLRNKWGLPLEQAYRLAVTEFDEGVAGHSLQAIHNLLPHLKAGLNYHDAVRAAAEQFRQQGRDWKARLYLHEYEREQEILDQISLEQLPDARNPVVNKCLHEARKLINAIIREYGKPAVIRVEMARDMKLSRKDKLEIEKRNRQNEVLNREAEEEVRGLQGREATRADKIKFRLWKEANEKCPYTGKTISLSMLFGPEVDVEHIIPFSQSLDDSFANKTICMAEENRSRKKCQAPRKAYEGTTQYEQILQRVDEMRCGRHKKKLFRLDEAEILELYGDFAKRNLNDTRHLCVLVKDFLRKLGCEVQVGKGEATSALRHKWGLDTILAKEGEEKKNRDDHRHHAVDAAVIAATSPAYLKRLSDASARRERDEATGARAKLGDAKWEAPAPWGSFRDDVAASVKGIVVSHQATRGLSGALHEETAYGWDDKKKRFTARKAVSRLTDGEIEGIRDATLRERVRAYRAEVERAKKAFAAEKKAGDASGAFVEPELAFHDRHGKRRVVRRVKIDTSKADPDKMLRVQSTPSPALRLEPDPRAAKNFPFGSNHHFVLYDDRLSPRRTVEIVTMHEAARRAVRGEPIFQATIKQERYVPVMALCKGDIVEVAGERPGFYLIVSFSAENPIDVWLRPMQRATRSELEVRIRTGKDLGCIVRRLAVDRLGRVTPARDRVSV